MGGIRLTLFLIVLVQYFIANAIFGLGFNIQYGYAGVLNLAYIIFFAVGAYVDSILVLGSPNSPTNKLLAQTYFFGAHLPYPVPVVVGVLITVVFAALLSLVLVRRGVRLDVIALASVAVALLAYYVVGNQTSLFNGWSGLTGIPAPITWKGAGSQSVSVQMVTTVLGLAWLMIAYWFANRCGNGPFGRAFKCVRENEKLAEAYGKNPVKLKREAFVIGCGFAGLAGALFVQITNVWSPNAWTFPETVTIFAAVLLGGVGNNLGVLVGVALLDAIVGQGVKLIPSIGSNGNINAAIEWIVMGVVIIAVIWWRPRGIISERKPKWNVNILKAHGVQSLNGRESVFQDSLASPKITPANPQVSSGNVLDEDIVEQVTNVLPTNGFKVSHSAGPREISYTESTTSNDLVTRANISGPVLRGEDIEVTFGGVRAVDGASLVIPAGSVIGLLGPNGAGKSTLISALCGDTKLDGGRVFLGDKEVTGWPAWRLARRGVIRTYQSGFGFPRLTVLENVMAGLVGHPGETFIKGALQRGDKLEFEHDGLERGLEILNKVGLLSKWDSYASDLSGGQLRLLELARAMMASPKVLLLDEPLAGVNPAFIDQILHHIAAIRDEGVAILLVEHELSWVEVICNEVLVMVEGRIVAKGSMHDIRHDQTVIDAFLG